MKTANSRGTRGCEWLYAYVIRMIGFAICIVRCKRRLDNSLKIEYEPPRELTPELAIVLRKLD
jgi:hypothetical protein